MRDLQSLRFARSARWSDNYRKGSFFERWWNDKFRKRKNTTIL